MLRDLARKFGVKDHAAPCLSPELGHADFAEMIGSSRPMVSRLIAEMIANQRPLVRRQALHRSRPLGQ